METNDTIVQQTNVKFLTKLGKNAQMIETVLKQVYGQSAMKSSTIRKWVKRFRDRWESCEDNPCEGRHSTAQTDENIVHVLAAVREDRRKEVRMIAGELGLTKSLVHNILTQNLGIKKCVRKLCRECKRLSKSNVESHVVRSGNRWEMTSSIMSLQRISPGSTNMTLNWNCRFVNGDRNENHTRRKHKGVTRTSRPWSLFFFLYRRSLAP